jgi:hypothetical protein
MFAKMIVIRGSICQIIPIDKGRVEQRPTVGKD